MPLDQDYPAYSSKGRPPEWFTIQEGGRWIHWVHRNDYREHFHAIKYEDGQVWDVVNGWREYTATFNRETRQYHLDPVLSEQEVVVRVATTEDLPWMVAPEDFAQIREYLQTLRETTLSRKDHKILSDLLEKYKP